MKAELLLRARVVYSEVAFAEMVLWRLPIASVGSAHEYKYRLAYVVRGSCLLRYYNEAGKGDHRHRDGVEKAYRFRSAEQLIADFQQDIARWNDENRDA